MCCKGEQLVREESKESKEKSLYIFTSSMVVPSNSSTNDSSHLVGRGGRMKALHEAIKVILGPLLESELKGFVMKNRELVHWKCVPLLVSHCCGIPANKNISGV